MIDVRDVCHLAFGCMSTITMLWLELRLETLRGSDWGSGLEVYGLVACLWNDMRCIAGYSVELGNWMRIMKYDRGDSEEGS